MSELKDCPFCGGKAEGRSDRYFDYVYCTDCGIQGPEKSVNLKDLIVEWNTRTDGWISVDKPPKDFKVVLTIHTDDLCPTPAFCLEDNSDGMLTRIWLREKEGPEYVQIEGRAVELYRRPTHWMVLPEPPK